MTFREVDILPYQELGPKRYKLDPNWSQESYLGGVGPTLKPFFLGPWIGDLRNVYSLEGELLFAFPGNMSTSYFCNKFKECGLI